MKSNRIKRTTWLIPLILSLIIGITIIIDLIRIFGYNTYPQSPEKKLRSEQDKIYHDLVNDSSYIDWQGLDETLEFINNQYDCSDFRLVNIIRILYEFSDNVPEEVRTKIENILFGFRYWWDEPGGNSMCYWSENHQILFASAEYLIGQKYPDQIFTNSNLTGKEHALKAKKRILDWMEMRWKYGFTEFYSNVYYIEDIGGMINLIDYAEDPEIVEKMIIIMDLLFYDIAAQNCRNMFVSVSGRAYERNRKGGPNSTLGGITNYYFSEGKKPGSGMIYGLFHSRKYSPPRVLTEIGKDTGNVVVKQSNGLDIRELKQEGYFGVDDKSMMMQLGMEAFSNPGIIRNTMAFVRKKRMFSNRFLSDLRYLDFTILRLFHLEPLLIRILNPQTNGVAIQKGNTYTYKTKDYSLYTVQKYHPGEYGDQQHVAGMNISNSFAVFHSHPALEMNKKNQSPNYWVGYGYLPHVVQDSSVSLAIYDIPDKKKIMEMALLDYTYAWFPKESFDTVIIEKNYAFGKKGNTYCAMIGLNLLEYRDNENNTLIQKGKKTYWITEAGSFEDDGPFEKFQEKILQNKVSFDLNKLELQYQTKKKKFEMTFKGDFLINGNTVELKYNRFDSPYCKANQNDEDYIFSFKGKSLQLNFNKSLRKEF